MAVSSHLSEGERRRSPARAGLLGWILRLVAAMSVAGIVVLLAGFVMFAAALNRAEPTAVPHADGVVALTGGADRISDAVALLSDGKADRLLITGVNPSTSSAAIARVAPDAQKFLGCCIELGYEAANTIGNAAETSAWVHSHGIRSLIVVTSNYHMPRALAEIGHTVPDVALFAYPVVTDHARTTSLWEDGQRLRVVAWEYLKYIAVLVRLRLAPDHSVSSAVRAGVATAG